MRRDPQSRFVNERMHISQKDGTHNSVIPKWGGVTNPKNCEPSPMQRRNMKRGWSKVTGGQRLDIFDQEDLPAGLI
jgi:NAD(P)H-nitrite reductase large subunit